MKEARYKIYEDGNGYYQVKYRYSWRVWETEIVGYVGIDELNKNRKATIPRLFESYEKALEWCKADAEWYHKAQERHNQNRAHIKAERKIKLKEKITL